jgi:formylmethanofuran dehydrogenase subunit D
MSIKEMKEIRSQIGQLEAKKRDALKRLNEAALRHLGLSIGDRIIVTTRGVEDECSVTGVNGAAYSDNPTPIAVKIKKDGTVGTQSPGYCRVWRKKEAGE